MSVYVDGVNGDDNGITHDRPLPRRASRSGRRRTRTRVSNRRGRPDGRGSTTSGAARRSWCRSRSAGAARCRSARPSSGSRCSAPGLGSGVLQAWSILLGARAGAAGSVRCCWPTGSAGRSYAPSRRWPGTPRPWEKGVRPSPSRSTGRPRCRPSGPPCSDSSTGSRCCSSGSGAGSPTSPTGCVRP